MARSLDRDPGLARTHRLLAMLVRTVLSVATSYGGGSVSNLPEVEDIAPWLEEPPEREKRLRGRRRARRRAMLAGG